MTRGSRSWRERGEGEQQQQRKNDNESYATITMRKGTGFGGCALLGEAYKVKRTNAQRAHTHMGASSKMRKTLWRRLLLLSHNRISFSPLFVVTLNGFVFFILRAGFKWVIFLFFFHISIHLIAFTSFRASVSQSPLLQSLTLYISLSVSLLHICDGNVAILSTHKSIFRVFRTFGFAL